MKASMIIPIPFAIAIDDLGWMQGHNEGYLGEGPYRVGLKGKMTLNDYKPLVEIAQKAGVRLQGLFVLGELDRNDIVRSHPTIVPPTKAWYSEKDDSQLDIMSYVSANSDALEFGLHGVGHEYWPDPNSNSFKRAEWYNTVDKEPWPEESLRNHLDVFQQIMAQYGLDKSNNHSFPESFVPCAYSYFWNPQLEYGPYSLGALLGEYGVQFANTDFTKIPECNPPIDGGFDHGLHVINRFNFGNLWYMIGQLPTMPLKYQTTTFIETHWSNLLAQDDFLQESVTQSWVDYYREVGEIDNRYATKNTEEQHSQFLYEKHCRITHLDIGRVGIDNSKMPTDEQHRKATKHLVLKMPLESGEHLVNITLDGQAIPAYHEESGFALLYLPQLESRRYALEYEISPNMPTDIVWHNTTNNIYSTRKDESTQSIDIFGRFYGKQTISYLTNQAIRQVVSDNSLLRIESWEQQKGRLEITVSAQDFQGVTATVQMQ